MINNLILKRHLEIKMCMDEIEFVFLSNLEKYPIQDLVVNYITKEIYILNKNEKILLIKDNNIIKPFNFGMEKTSEITSLIDNYMPSPEGLLMNTAFIMDILLSKRPVKLPENYPRLYKSLDEDTFKSELKSLIPNHVDYLIFLEDINPIINIISFNLLIYYVCINVDKINLLSFKDINTFKFSENVEFNFLKDWLYI